MLVLIPWVALLLLILHDATKDDSDGSALLIAAKKLGAFTDWVMLKTRTSERLAAIGFRR